MLQEKQIKSFHFFAIICFGIVAIILDPIIRSKTLVIDDDVNIIFQYITRMGDAVFAIPFVLAILVKSYFSEHQSRKKIIDGFIKTVITMLVGTIFINVGKFLVGRARPKLFQEFGAYHFEPFNISYDYLSFPSGHTTTWGLLAFSMAFIFPKYRYLWYVSAIIVGASRVILGSHYVSDVFFSLLLSYVIVYYCHVCINISFISRIKHKLGL